jgi:hypothetical protein
MSTGHSCSIVPFKKMKMKWKWKEKKRFTKKRRKMKK